MKFDKNDIEHREFVVLEDMIFLDEEELMKYLNSCETRFETGSFVPNIKAMMRDWMLSEDDLRDDLPENEWKEAVQDYDEFVSDLLSTYEIEYFRKSRDRYILTGAYDDLKKFSEEYASDIGMDMKGVALSDFEEECEVDIDSGDDDYILGRLSG